MQQITEIDVVISMTCVVICSDSQIDCSLRMWARGEGKPGARSRKSLMSSCTLPDPDPMFESVIEEPPPFSVLF